LVWPLSLFLVSLPVYLSAHFYLSLSLSTY